jgi:hypothetical protein
MHTKTILTIFAIVTALGFIVTATSLPTHAFATRFGITLCSSLDTVGGKACLPTDKAPGPVGFTR